MKTRDHKKAHAMRQQRYHRLAWEIPREQWQTLTQSQQTQCKTEVREVIRKYVDGVDKNEL